MAFRALLLGNWEYTDPADAFAPLNGPGNDLVLMERALSDVRYGLFEVQTGKNLSSQRLGRVFLEFLQNATPDDTLLMYFSGHGARRQDGRLALCGVDTESAFGDATTFDTNLLREWIEHVSRASSTMVILDCCYSGAMKSAPVDIEVSLGTGTMVLSSSGSQPTKDADHPDEASPFTAALAGILLDGELPGENGMLTADAVYKRLIAYEPPLRPLPTRNVQSQGTFPLARRARVAEPSRPDLVGFHQPAFEAIDLRFDGERVTADSEAATPETFELVDLDENRMSAVRRMSQLTDAVLRVTEYEDDEWAQRAVRRAWNCVGTNLFETALPPGVKRRIRSLGEAPAGTPLLKLRLTFEDNERATLLESYPWEYLFRERDFRAGHDASEPQPMALEPRLLLERVIRRDGPATLDTRIEGPATVGLVSSQRDPFGQTMTSVADPLIEMPDLNTVFDLRGSRASWGNFVDVVDQAPDLLLMFTPVRRRPRGVEVGFWTDPARPPDWRSASDLIDHLSGARLTFKAIVLVTFAAKPSQDSFRATSELARALARAGIGPVVFVCHSAAYAKSVPDLGRDTFPVLFVDAITRGERFDHAVYYAKNRVALRASPDDRRAFGVPGYYVSEPGKPETADLKATGHSPGSSFGTLRTKAIGA